MADYLVPMAVEPPDVEVAHVEAPTVAMNAVNDALRPLGAAVLAQPLASGRFLRALGKSS
jgi:hypothetical protein